MKVLLLRHGAVAENLQGCYIGHEDPPLYSAGQSAWEAMRRKAAVLPVERVYTSPLKRCVHTARMLFPHAFLLTLPMLIERDFGDFSGMTHGQITALPGYENWGMSEEQMPFPGGEEKDVFLGRCRRVWEQMLSDNSSREWVAAVTHGGVIMGILHCMMPASSMFDWQCGNCEGYIVTMEQEPWGWKCRDYQKWGEGH